MGEGQALWTHLLTGLGLAGAAGLNAYVPLLGVAVLARLHVLTLSPPLDLLGHPLVIGVLAVSWRWSWWWTRSQWPTT